MDPLSVLGPFVDMAKEKYGVKRFVLLSASALERVGWGMGEVHEYLADLGEKGEVEWCVLRPTWFMENLSESQHLPTIRDEGKLYSATGDGKLPWVSAEDIASVAFKVLVDGKSHNCDYVVVGPELLSYGQLADTLTHVLGKPITHVNLTEEKIRERFISRGVNEEYAKILAGMDTIIKEGREEFQNDVVWEVGGKKPKTFRDFAEGKKAIWL
ncbi:MAG: hypothetical protein Q9218_007236 [Villophora microphyllina]